MSREFHIIIFNNYNNDQPANSKENYIIAEFKYSGSKIPDVKEFIRVVKEHFEKAKYKYAEQWIFINKFKMIDSNLKL